MVDQSKLQTVLTLVTEDKRKLEITLPIQSKLEKLQPLAVTQSIDPLKFVDALKFVKDFFYNLSDPVPIKVERQCRRWCEKNGWTDMFEEGGRFFAFPPGAVIPLALPEFYGQ